ncbi:MAG TPA: folylpolyglutamate synthase/dihydrofolate synthase family protein [Candidatus Dormibacteraeota bacterium]|jgi:dihydrofolate synthase/folylpolyglutamate synthase|nr:folylpolyglutamate synthase/dihydrofolate synthase family protein [Candidatus Dormibacteraeota bacterium]
MLTYRESLDFLVGTGSRGIKAGLDRIDVLLDVLGHPEAGLRGVLVAGTNGKGSVCAMVDSVVRSAGLSSVLLVKPHLCSYRERIVIDGRHIEEAHFAALVERIRPAVDAVEPRAGAPTQFEILTALGILAAAERRPDVLVCEVGLGGRLDSTNVLDLGVAAITNVAMDHTEYLGDTVEQIAAEKAGILKPGADTVTGATGPALEVIRAQARHAGVRSLRVVGEDIRVEARSLGRQGIEVDLDADGLQATLQSPLPGIFQADNVAVTAGIVLALRERGLEIGDEGLRTGLASVQWPARLQWIPGAPVLLIDGGHNPAAIHTMLPAVRELTDGRPLSILFGAMSDKDVPAMLDELRPLGAPPVFTQMGTPRAMSAVELARLWGPGSRAISSLPDALQAARLLAGRNGAVLVCGSLHLAGDVLRLLGQAPEPI